MLNRIESLIITIARWVLVISACVLLVFGVFGTLYLGLVNLTASPDNISRPDVRTPFIEPERSPVEEADRKRRVRDAQKSFSSKEDDAFNQTKLAGENARSRDRDIRTNYGEQIIKPENKGELGKLSELATFREDSIAENCDEKSSRMAAIVSRLDDDLVSIAQDFNVEPTDISTDHKDPLEAYGKRQLPRSCEVLSNNLVAISKNLRETYPADWGLGGDETKSKISSMLVEDAENLREGTDEEFANQAMEQLVSYSESLRDYYVPVTRELDDRNELTSQTVMIIGEDITAAYVKYLDSAVKEWSDYQNSIRTASDDSLARKAWSAGLLASSGFFWLCALATLILIAFFAMERHQRSLKHLEEKKTA
jgi:hypothetical protein